MTIIRDIGPGTRQIIEPPPPLRLWLHRLAGTLEPDSCEQRDDEFHSSAADEFRVGADAVCREHENSDLVRRVARLGDKEQEARRDLHSVTAEVDRQEARLSDSMLADPDDESAFHNVQKLHERHGVLTSKVAALRQAWSDAKEAANDDLRDKLRRYVADCQAEAERQREAALKSLESQLRGKKFQADLETFRRAEFTLRAIDKRGPGL